MFHKMEVEKNKQKIVSYPKQIYNMDTNSIIGMRKSD